MMQLNTAGYLFELWPEEITDRKEHWPSLRSRFVVVDLHVGHQTKTLQYHYTTRFTNINLNQN